MREIEGWCVREMRERGGERRESSREILLLSTYRPGEEWESGGHSCKRSAKAFVYDVFFPWRRALRRGVAAGDVCGSGANGGGGSALVASGGPDERGDGVR